MRPRELLPQLMQTIVRWQRVKRKIKDSFSWEEFTISRVPGKPPLKRVRNEMDHRNMMSLVNERRRTAGGGRRLEDTQLPNIGQSRRDKEILAIYDEDTVRYLKQEVCAFIIGQVVSDLLEKLNQDEKDALMKFDTTYEQEGRMPCAEFPLQDLLLFEWVLRQPQLHL
jgi:hypothetical protein